MHRGKRKPQYVGLTGENLPMEQTPMPKHEPPTQRMIGMGVTRLAIFPRFAVAFFGEDPRCKVQVSREFANWLVDETVQIPAKR